MTLATRICLIDNGVLQQYAAPLEVYSKPTNLFTADFVGNPSINFIEAAGDQRLDGAFELTVSGGRRAVFTPKEKIDLTAWRKERDEMANAKAERHSKNLLDKSYIEKGIKTSSSVTISQW